MKARIPGNQQGGRAAMLKRLEEMQAEMEAKQKQVEETDFAASAGGGAVEAVVTGGHQLKSLNIQPDVVDPEDVEMLADLIIAAVNEASRKAEDAMGQVMDNLKGMGLPF